MSEYIKKADYLRWVLTVLLLIGVHSETGLWTTVFAVIVALGLEGQTLVNRIQIDQTKQFVELFRRFRE